jgi:hypothetical protein
MDEFEHMEQMALDNYMEESVANQIFRLLAPIPFNELPTLGDWIDD